MKKASYFHCAPHPFSLYIGHCRTTQDCMGAMEMDVPICMYADGSHHPWLPHHQARSFLYVVGTLITGLFYGWEVSLTKVESGALFTIFFLKLVYRFIVGYHFLLSEFQDPNRAGKPLSTPIYYVQGLTWWTSWRNKEKSFWPERKLIGRKLYCHTMKLYGLKMDKIYMAPNMYNAKNASWSYLG